VRYANQLPAYLALIATKLSSTAAVIYAKLKKYGLREGQRRDEHLAAPLIWFCLRARMGLG
jgi:hypothetical protein